MSITYPMLDQRDGAAGWDLERSTLVASEIEFQLHSSVAFWTYEMWERLPNDGNRYEIIDGVLYMATAPGFSHGQVVLNLLRYVELPLDKRGIAFGIMAPIGLVMPSNDPVVQPDFLLIRSDRRHLISEDGRIRGVPDLIAEVLSASHADYDLITKRRAYARAGVPQGRAAHDGEFPPSLRPRWRP